MQEYAFRKNFETGKINYGIWVTCSDLMVCDIVSHLGFDFVVIDTEHSFINIESLRDLLLVIRRAGIFPVVRVCWNELFFIKQVLDAGAEGIIIPMVCTKEQAEKGVSYCKYPPEGIRGLGPLGACEFGRTFKEYVATANKRLFIAIQIEHIEAVKNLENILQVRGIDGMFIGPADLAASMGLIGDLSNPKVQEQISIIISKALKYNIPAGIAVSGSGKEILQRLNTELKGIQFLTVSSDMELIMRSGKELINTLKG